MDQTQTPQPEPKKKSRKWLWILGGLFLFFLIIGITAPETEDSGNTNDVATNTDQSADVNDNGLQNENADDNTGENTEPASYSKIELTDVDVSNSNVVITGSTNLPDGATVTVWLDPWGREETELYIGVNEKVSVTQGGFTAELTPPQREEFQTNSYAVKVSFTPRGQSEDVLALVGNDGENLSGDLVDESGSFKTMALTERRELQLSIQLPDYTFQTPADFDQGSAEYALAEYVQAWKNQDWEKMAEYTQLTWKSESNDPAEELSSWFGFKDLKGFEMTGTNTVSDVTRDITFVVQYEFTTNQISKKEITARVIKETSAYMPDNKGQWGVNPISTFSENDLD